MMPKRTLLCLIFAVTLSGCGPEPLTDCENGLCGHEWALEIDSTVAHAEAQVQAQPNDADALLGLADAYLQKSSFMKNQTDTRADFWLSSNLKEIDRLLEEGLKACDKVLLLKQDSAEAYDLKGRMFYMKSQLVDYPWDLMGKSISYHEKAASLRPNSAEFWYNLGVVRRQTPWLWSDEATWDCFANAARLDPTFAKAYAALSSRETRTTENAARTALRFGADDPDVLRMVAEGYNSYALRQNFARSIRSLPSPAKAPFFLGFSFFVARSDEFGARLIGQVVRMEHHFTKDHIKLSRSAGDVKHWKIWAERFGGLGRSYGSQSFFRDIANFYPTHPLAWFYWGRSHNHRDFAIGLLEKAIELDSSFALAYYALAATYAEKGDWVQAEQWLRETQGRASNNEFIALNVHLLSAFVHARKKEMGEMMRDLELALQMDPGYARRALENGIYSGHAYENIRFLLDEPLDLQSAGSLAERKLLSHLNYSNVTERYYTSGQFRTSGKVNRFLEKAIELDPQNQEARLFLARSYSDADQYDKAIGLAQEVLRMSPENAKAHAGLGQFYLNKHDVVRARQELSKAYEMGDFVSKMILDEIEKSELKKRGR